MKLNKLQFSPLSMGRGIVAALLVTIVTGIIVFTACGMLFDWETLSYMAPDANHTLPVVIVWMLGLAGLCCIFLIRLRRKHYLLWIARVFAAVLIFSITYGITSQEWFYYYDNNNKCWGEKNIYGATRKMVENNYVRTFGNVLLIKNSEKQKNDDSMRYIQPYIYLPDGSKTSLFWVQLPYDVFAAEETSFAFFCNDSIWGNIGVVDGNLHVTVSPSTYKEIVDYVDEYIIVRNKDDKEGLINAHGDSILPFIYDKLKFYNDLGCRFYKGGYLGAFKDGETFFVDTLGNALSGENYSSLYPDEWTHFMEPDEVTEFEHFE